jgi:predicted nucleic acid-binding protein
MPDTLLILDDMKARRLARTLHLQLTGTLGVLIKAKQVGIIDAIKPILVKIQASHFHIADELIEEVLRISQE